MLRRGAGQTCYFCNRYPGCFCEKQHRTLTRSAGNRRPEERRQPRGAVRADSARGLRGRARESDVAADQSRDNDSTATGPHPGGPASSAGGGRVTEQHSLGCDPPALQPPGQEPLSARLRSPQLAGSSLRGGGGARQCCAGDRGHSGRGSALSDVSFQISAAVSLTGAFGRIRGT